MRSAPLTWCAVFTVGIQLPAVLADEEAHRPQKRTCSAYSSDRITDHIEIFVFALSRKPDACRTKNCCIVPNNNVLLRVSRGSKATIFVKSVFFDRLSKAKPFVPILITPVSTEGRPLDVSAVALDASLLVTGRDGIAEVGLTVTNTKDRQPFRLRLDYKDRELQSYGLSPHIVVDE